MKENFYPALGAYLLILSRSLLIMSALLYAFSLSITHQYYLNEIWEYFGFTFAAQEPVDALSKYLLVGIVALVLPKNFKSPGSIIVFLLFIIVYVPAVIMTIGVSTYDFEKHFPLLISLCFVFFVLCVVVRGASSSVPCIGYQPNNFLFYFISALWFVCCTVLVYNYRNIMQFAGLDEVYEQRAAGASTSAVIGYIQVYFSNVLSPALVAIGLVWRRWLIVAMGTFGCFIMYLIDAQRTVFLIPFVMMAIYFCWNRASGFFLSSTTALTFLSGIVFICTALYPVNSFFYSLSTYLIFRTIAIPGLSFSQYFDLFNYYGLTYWSHVKFIDFFVRAPDSFAQDPLWPRLGYIIGDRVYNNATNNVNANLFSGDGAAAAGAAGVICIGLFFAIWLFYLERISRFWDKRFIVLIFVPVALSLSNGHFFTVMLSFGGLFWSLVLLMPFVRK